MVGSGLDCGERVVACDGYGNVLAVLGKVMTPGFV
jgi:hypothetical protein